VLFHDCDGAAIDDSLSVGSNAGPGDDLSGPSAPLPCESFLGPVIAGSCRLLSARDPIGAGNRAVRAGDGLEMHLITATSDACRHRNRHSLPRGSSPCLNIYCAAKRARVADRTMLWKRYGTSFQPFDPDLTTLVETHISGCPCKVDQTISRELKSRRARCWLRGFDG